MYQNLRVVRSNDPDEHPIFLGPIFLHRDADFAAYNYFFATIKSSLCVSVDAFELKLGEAIYICSDEEKALIKAIESNFPAALRFLCVKHVKEGTIAYMQKEVGIPQKDRIVISQSIFGKDGMINAATSFEFDDESGDVLSNVSKFPKFAEYFTKKLKTTLECYVNIPSRNTPFSQLWTNNNCESMNHNKDGC